MPSTICSVRRWWSSRSAEHHGRLRPILLAVGVVALLTGCDAPAPTFEPIFLGGRAVAPSGDSLFAVTVRDAQAVVVYDALGRVRDTLGMGLLHNPGRLQAVGADWYVSDADSGAPSIVVLAHDGSLVRRISLEGRTNRAHQFAVLPDGGIVVEGLDGRLVTIRGDSVETFAVVELGNRPSLIVGASGGVLHAIPDKTITLYNGFGHIRWRTDWPWAETAFVSDIGEDSRGRIHVIAGVAQSDTFIAYSMTPGGGEVVRWSEPAVEGSFLVSRLGEIVEARGRWAGRN